MMSLWVIFAIVGALVVAFLLLAFGAWRSHRKHRAAGLESLKNIRPKMIPVLKAEFTSEIAQKFDRVIADPPTDDDLMFIDENIKNGQMLSRLRSDELLWNFVRLVGGFLADLMIETKGFRVVEEDSEPVFLRKNIGDAQIDAFPFEKVIKHYEQGTVGDLLAYVKLNDFIEKDVAGQHK